MNKLQGLALAVLIAISMILGGCQTQPSGPCRLDLRPVTYKSLPGWKEDKVLKALPAIKRSCAAILKKDPNASMLTQVDSGGTASDWHPFCNQILSDPPQTEAALRQEIQHHLKPYLVSCSGNSSGLFTGYDEPELRGSKHRHGHYQTPLYRLPGSKIRYKGMPRSRIVRGGLKGRGLELAWVDDPVAAFFLQIQGSGRIRLENGQVMRIGYAGTNGCG